MKKIKTTTKSRFGRIHIAMIRAIVNFAMSPANLTVTDLIPGFKALINRLQDNLMIIDDLQALAALPITGWAAQKDALRKVVGDVTYSMMSATKSYAMDNNDPVLANQMTITRGDLEKMSIQDFMSTVTAAINIITPLTAALEDWGITPTGVSGWTTTKTALQGMIANPKAAITYRKTIHENIQQMIIQCLNCLNLQCDPFVYSLQSASTTYFTTWFNNRKLYPNGRVITRLRAIVENELNEPIEGATVMVLDMDVPFTTNVNGECTVDHVPFGNHSVVIINGGINKTFGPYRFKKGQSHTIHFTMSPSFVSPEQAAGIVSSKNKTNA